MTPLPPVAFFIFRRPDLTQRVFETIRQARPPRLFVIADGPRTPDEAALCDQTRAIIDVDWPCEVVTDYADSNLGLRRRLITGISRVFEQVDEAIFLEDDCLPDPTFFRYCAELLERYRDEPRVMHISGDCVVPNQLQSSYYFTRYPHVWGWASWRRAWAQYDATLAEWADPVRREHFLAQSNTPQERRFWEWILEDVRRGRINTWDYQWLFAIRQADGLSVNPAVNLVQNLGVGPTATNTRGFNASEQSLPQHEAMTFPLLHPVRVEANAELDALAAQRFFSQSPRRFGWLRERWYAVKARLGIAP